MRVFILFFLFLSSCSVYRSQGRRDFETDVPSRVPISVIFHCRDMSAAEPTTQILEIESLKANYPDLIIRENITQETVVLLASREGSSTVCISEGLDFTEYVKKLKF